MTNPPSPANKLATYLDSCFRIRVKVPGTENAVLGVLPVVALLLVWTLTTWGRTERLVVPEGRVGDTDGGPAIGQACPDDTSYLVPGFRRIDVELEKDRFETFLTGSVASYPLHSLPSREVEGGVRVKLPRGTFIGTITQEIGVTVGAEVTPVGRGGTRLPPPPATMTVNLWVYLFEDVQSRLITRVILPSPMEVVRSLRALWNDRRPFWNVGHSFKRVALGFLVALAVTFPLGIFMGSFSRWKSLFAPLMTFGGYLPIPTLVPLTMSLFGTSELQKVMFLALGFGIYLLPLFVRAIEEVDNVYLQTAYTLGATRAQTVWHILLGIAWPNIFDAMRMGFGIGWGYIILAEMVDMGSGGVGALILVSQRQGPREHIYLVLLIIVLIAFITDKLWEWGGDWAFPYRRMKR
ncbi:MAG: ABC transporter permease subunit [Candidatus Riflebacteria bacterium]|nr:ABC transporter permease subunit [Candidatus Riflebacteria bacterium]